MFEDEREEGQAPEAGLEPDVSAESPAAEPRAPGEPQAAAAQEGDAAAAQEGAAAPEGDAAAEASATRVSEPGGRETAGGQAEAQVERQRRERGRRKKEQESDEPEVIPGAHLEPDLVLEPERREEEEDEFARYAVEEEPAEGVEERAEEAEAAPQPVAAAPLDLAADARYQATGKRKSSVARVILRPGSGEYRVNGRPLEAYFPRRTLQVAVRQPLEATGNADRMDVVARIHGGGVASQAGALRHGIARALVEADPNLRGELKRRGFLTRDARVKERKKAGLKKARKRPQFSKR
jgi:small subunit ribosomal protein S9